MWSLVRPENDGSFEMERENPEHEVFLIVSTKAGGAFARENEGRHWKGRFQDFRSSLVPITFEESLRKALWELNLETLKGHGFSKGST